MASDDLAAEHDKFRDEAIEMFVSTKKMGGEEFSESFLLKLSTEIDVSLVFLLFECNCKALSNLEHSTVKSHLQYNPF